MKKVIALIRTSTDRQEVETQKQEVVSLILTDSYKEDEIEIIGGAGASAIKLDEQYTQNLNKVYELISAGSIEAVYAWGIDRIGRNEEVLMKFKNTLIKNKIQLVIKNPNLKLLNPDGSVNAGVELAFSLFATMAKQEMETKKERFARGKKRNAQSGKYNGGGLTYGYTLNEQGFYVPDPDESEIVKLAFELMATDKFSVTGVTKELRERGVIYKDSLITFEMVKTILKNTSYIGYRNRYGLDKVYPRIISDELYNKVQSIIKNNNSSKGKATKHYNFASLLIKCPNCGRNYIAHRGRYICSAVNAPKLRRNFGQTECNNNLLISVHHLDGVLWSLSLRLHHKHLQGLDASEKIQMKQDIELLDKKIIEAEKQLTELADKLNRIEDIYIERGNVERYETGKKKIDAERSIINNSIAKFKEEKSNLETLLTAKPDDMSKWTDDNFIISQLRFESTEKMMYDLVHQYISGIEIERAEMPDVICDSYIIENGQPVKKDYKLSGRKAVKVRIYCYDKTTVDLYYVPNFRWASTKCFTVESGSAIPFEYEPIIRENDIVTTESTNRSIAFIKAVEKVADIDKFFSDAIFDVILRYGANYSGDFTEEADEALRDVKRAYHSLHSLRDLRTVMTTLSASGKYFNVSIDMERVLSRIKM